MSSASWASAHLSVGVFLIDDTWRRGLLGLRGWNCHLGQRADLGLGIQRDGQGPLPSTTLDDQIDAITRIFAIQDRKDFARVFTPCPLTETMTSPDRMPATTAGPPMERGPTSTPADESLSVAPSMAPEGVGFSGAVGTAASTTARPGLGHDAHHQAMSRLHMREHVQDVLHRGELVFLDRVELIAGTNAGLIGAAASLDMRDDDLAVFDAQLCAQNRFREIACRFRGGGRGILPENDRHRNDADQQRGRRRE